MNESTFLLCQYVIACERMLFIWKKENNHP